MTAARSIHILVLEAISALLESPMDADADLEDAITLDDAFRVALAAALAARDAFSLIAANIVICNGEEDVVDHLQKV